MDAVLIDGNSLLYRAYFAMIRAPLRNSKGENTSAVYGFANSLRKLQGRFQPTYLAVVFDAPGKTFRHDRYRDYKVQRPRAPDELIAQMPIVKQIVAASGLRQFEIPEVEADDVLGTLARKLSVASIRVYLVTSDKDLLQLVDDRVSTYDPFRDVVYNPEEVRKRYGVGPERIADLLALTGDSSDNIPGVPGIGPKRAQEILLKFGSLDEAIKQDRRVQVHRDIALMSKALTEIRTDVPLSIATDELKPQDPDRSALIRLFTELEFTALLREISAESPVEIKVIQNGKLSDLAGFAELGISLDDHQFLLAATEREVTSVGWNDPQLVARILTNPAILKVGFDLKPLLKQYQNAGVQVSPIADVMVAGWLVDPNRKHYELDELLLQHCRRAVSAVETHRVPAYALGLYAQLRVGLESWQLTSLFNGLEMPLEHVLAAMERRGVRLDRDLLAALGVQLARDIESLDRSIQNQAGMTFNAKSPQQLSHVLFEKLKLKPGRRTKTGFSTEASILQELAEQSPLVGDILKLRELMKLQTTYLEPLGRLSDPRTGRIRTNFNQTGTATGRLSASEPNLQNVPIRSELGRKIRAAFVAEPGYRLISADYAQIELRVLAEISGDANLKGAFASGLDVHNRTAAAILHVPEKDVTPEMRRIAKMVNYGLVYGMSDYGLSGRLGMGREESKTFIEGYMALYPGVARWIEEIVAQARRDGYTRTVFGRIRPIPDLKSPNRQVAEAARRTAINSPIQGTAADIIKRAMIAVEARLRAERFKGGMTLQIHDELLFEIEQERVAEAEQIVRESMQNAWPIETPLRVDIGKGTNWAEIH